MSQTSFDISVSLDVSNGGGKVVSAEDAVRLIRSGDTVATSGFVGIGFAEEIAIALERRFLEEGVPRDLTLVYAGGQGDGKGKGLNHFGHVGMVKRVGRWSLGSDPGARQARGGQQDRGVQPAARSHLLSLP